MRGRVKIDSATIEQLERLSLVNFGNEEGIRTLEDAIAFAEPLKEASYEVTNYHFLGGKCNLSGRMNDLGALNNVKSYEIHYV